MDETDQRRTEPAERKFFSKRDVWIAIFLTIALIGAFAVASAANRASDGGCEVILDGRTAEIIDLGVDGDYSIDSLPGIAFTVKDHAIAFTASDCGDKTCVKTGYISKPGEMAVCLPNKVALRIVFDGKKQNDVDAIVW